MENSKGILDTKQLHHHTGTYIMHRVEVKELDDTLLHQLADIIEISWKEYNRPISIPETEFIIQDLKYTSEVERVRQRFIYLHEDRVICYISMDHNTGTHNLDKATISISMLPEYRGKQLEKLFFAATTDYIVEGIQFMEFWVREGDEELFEIYTELITRGAKRGYTGTYNGARMDQYNRDEVSKETALLRAAAEQKGYTFLIIHNGRFKSEPSLHYPSYLQLVERIWNDMPREDADWEDETCSEELHQSLFEHIEKKKEQVITVIAMHQETGQPIGFTETWFSDYNPGRIIQEDTGVLAEHRGHQLGLTLKYIMLDLMLHHERYAQAKYWTTGNASRNAPMLRINNILGYETLFKQIGYSVPLEDYLSLIRE
ncbi:MAG: hypothetical protein INQ03_07990 [Candidatus Heimdallarchaeota archaeon]|nr:hypothetical protein [Candidatus Heimdallarchaeota archaeon]